MSFVQSYLVNRLLGHRVKGLRLLNTIEKTAERLVIENGDETKFEEYALSLLHLASRGGGIEVYSLFLPEPDNWDPRELDYELLNAAAYTNNVSLVKRLEPPLEWKDGVLGNPYHAAVLGRSFDILKFFLKDPQSIGPRTKYRLVCKAAKNGDKEMVEFILQADWAPRKFFPVMHDNGEDRLRRLRFRYRKLRMAFQTPSIEIFNIIMQEWEICAEAPLARDFLDEFLRDAAARGWVDMTRHIISLGAPPESPAERRDKTGQPLYFACEYGHDEVVKLLLDHNVHLSGAELEAAAKHGHASTLKLLLEQGIDVHSVGAKNCLAAAAAKGHLGIVRMLLDAGMSPDEGSIAPMIQAVRAEHPGICQLLSERGATMSVAQARASLPDEW
jgi:hypothetical protein